jgi:pyruvate formate lyase activating enzyme
LIFDIRHFTVHDGPGIRTTVFFKGCPLNCLWCHNPESQSPVEEEIENVHSLDGKKFLNNETVGQWMTVHEVIAEIEKDRIFYDESNGGVTLSGGEPLFQPEFLYELLKELKQEGFHVALDTCGFADKSVFERVLPFIDLFLYDLKIIDDNDHIKYTGVSNQIILANLRFLSEKGKKIIIRIPVIPGINDTIDNWESLFPSSPLTLFPSYPHTLHEIHLLPYHSIAREKYSRIGLISRLKDIPDMKKEDLLLMKKEFEARGFIVKIGG